MLLLRLQLPHKLAVLVQLPLDLVQLLSHWKMGGGAERCGEDDKRNPCFTLSI